MDRDYKDYSEVRGYVSFIDSKGMEIESLRIGFLRANNSNINILTTTKKQKISMAHMKIKSVQKIKVRVFDDENIYVYEEIID